MYNNVMSWFRLCCKRDRVSEFYSMKISLHSTFNIGGVIPCHFWGAPPHFINVTQCLPIPTRISEFVLKGSWNREDHPKIFNIPSRMDMPPIIWPATWYRQNAGEIRKSPGIRWHCNVDVLEDGCTRTPPGCWKLKSCVPNSTTYLFPAKVPSLEKWTFIQWRWRTIRSTVSKYLAQSRSLRCAGQIRMESSQTEADACIGQTRSTRETGFQRLTELWEA